MSAPLRVGQGLRMMCMGKTVPAWCTSFSSVLMKTPITKSSSILDKPVQYGIRKTLSSWCSRTFTSGIIKSPISRYSLLLDKYGLHKTSVQLGRCSSLRYHSTLTSRTTNKHECFQCHRLTPLPMTRTVVFLRRKVSYDYRNYKSDDKNTSTLIYILSLAIVVVGCGYAAVPLYRAFCAATGRGGQSKDAKGHNMEQVASMRPVMERLLTVKFNSDTGSSMRWDFKPQQTKVVVTPGETALAFYRATNPTDKPIIGISTYNVLPFEAGKYFNKIQCFCFEEQRLNPHESVDMPVFFYIDPEYTNDPFLFRCNEIYLSYTFFEAKEGMHIPLPGYMQNPS